MSSLCGAALNFHSISALGVGIILHLCSDHAFCVSTARTYTSPSHLTYSEPFSLKMSTVV